MHGPLNVKLKEGKTNLLKLRTFGSQIFVFVLWAYNTYPATYAKNFISTVSDLSSDRLNKFLHSYGAPVPSLCYVIFTAFPYYSCLICHEYSHIYSRSFRTSPVLHCGYKCFLITKYILPKSHG
jgi:hypothetical protein